jgi:hypothetical protein
MTGQMRLGIGAGRRNPEYSSSYLYTDKVPPKHHSSILHDLLTNLLVILH